LLASERSIFCRAPLTCQKASQVQAGCRIWRRTPDHPYDAIIFYAFNRFFRNVAEMELTIRKLRKHGVEVVSVTQPTGDDPSQILVRQIIGAFDEHTSREISKNTTRAMRESAKQGFWNGATPPLGYKIVEAERRGQKIKKKLDIDTVEAETVRLMYSLYLEGRIASPRQSSQRRVDHKSSLQGIPLQKPAFRQIPLPKNAVSGF
jgi:DNA invertase Pin-like site-specific DNA recombinase